MNELAQATPAVNPLLRKIEEMEQSEATRLQEMTTFHVDKMQAAKNMLGDITFLREQALKISGCDPDEIEHEIIHLITDGRCGRLIDLKISGALTGRQSSAAPNQSNMSKGKPRSTRPALPPGRVSPNTEAGIPAATAPTSGPPVAQPVQPQTVPKRDTAPAK